MIQTKLNEYSAACENKNNEEAGKIIDQIVDLVKRKSNLTGDAVWHFGSILLCSPERHVECLPVFVAASCLVMRKASNWKTTNEEWRRALSIAQRCARGMYLAISKIIKCGCIDRDVVRHHIIPLIIGIRDEMEKARSVHKKQRSVAAVRVMLFAGQSAAENSDLDLALKIYEDGLARLDKVVRKIHTTTKIYCFICEQMGYVFEEMKRLDDAIFWFKEAIDVHKSLQNYGKIIFSFGNIGWT